MGYFCLKSITLHYFLFLCRLWILSWISYVRILYNFKDINKQTIELERSDFFFFFRLVFRGLRKQSKSSRKKKQFVSTPLSDFLNVKGLLISLQYNEYLFKSKHNYEHKFGRWPKNDLIRSFFRSIYVLRALLYLGHNFG